MAQKLWPATADRQYRSWGALAGEHKHKQRQTPCYLLRSNLIGFSRGMEKLRLRTPEEQAKKTSEQPQSDPESFRDWTTG